MKIYSMEIVWPLLEEEWLLQDFPEQMYIWILYGDIILQVHDIFSSVALLAIIFYTCVYKLACA